MGDSLTDIFTKTPTVGKHLGRISYVDDDGFQILLQHDLGVNSKIRIINNFETDASITEVKKLFVVDENESYSESFLAKKGQIIFIPNKKNSPVQNGDEVFLVSNPDIVKYRFDFKKKINFMSFDSKKNKILKDIKIPSIISKNQEIYVRIDQPDWLNLIPYDDIDGVLLNFTKRAWDDSIEFMDYIFENQKKIIVEFPLFIAETNLQWYINQTSFLRSKGINKFCLSQISQKLFFKEDNLDDELFLMTNENVYLLNDMAVKHIQEELIDSYIYPLENDVDNMISGNDRYGIVPMYFYPKLFYSRMPINVKPEDLITDKNNRYRKFIKEGITVITTHNPVSWIQYRDKLFSKGFSRFLLDVSFGFPQNGVINELINNLNSSKSIGETGKFNFKKGLW